MGRTIRCALVLAAVLVFHTSLVAARQVILTPAGASQTEADKKYNAIVTGGSGPRNPADLGPKLDAFIRENPDYPRLSIAYNQLLIFASMAPWDPDRILLRADEALAKWPNNSQLRMMAIAAKFVAFKAQKNDDATRALVLKLLDSESDPMALRGAASRVDPADALKLLEKGIADLRKLPPPPPERLSLLDDLQWDYAQALARVGRKDEADKVTLEVLAAGRKAIAALEALPANDSKRSMIAVRRSSLGNRYSSLCKRSVEAGDYEKALEYVTLWEQTSKDSGLSDPEEYDNQRADIYTRMGKADLALYSYMRSFALSMDARTHDRIVELASKLGKKPDEVFASARDIRSQKAQAIKPFELKRLDGGTIALGSIKGKAILVNFFFPT